MPQPPQLAAANPNRNPAHQAAASRSRAGRTPQAQLRNALVAQRVAFQDATQPDVAPKDRASLMRAYHDLTRLVMDLTGMGKPAPVPARNDPARQPKRPVSTEPLD